MSNVPAQWIGVRADWMLYGDRPWEHLVSLTPTHLNTHGYGVGRSGCGKSTAMLHLINRDIEQGHSIAVLDPYSDLVNSVIEICAGRADPNLVKIIDLREKERPFGFNPLLGSGQPAFRALHVLDVVAKEAESFGVRLAETLRFCLMALAEAAQPLTQLERIFYDRPYRLSLLSGPVLLTEPVQMFWERFDQLPLERQTAMAEPVMNKVSLLLSTPTLRKILGHPEPIDLGQHLNTPGSILLVSLAYHEHHGAARMFGSLILSSICEEIFARVDTPESRRNGIRLYVDEFQTFSSLDFESMFVVGRRFKCFLFVCHQTLAQLSPRLRSIILNNVGLKIIFQTGREDSATLSKDLFGDPRAYDFTELPVGYCVLWRRDIGAVEVEINEPLIRDVGARSADARKFLDEVYKHAGSSVEETTASDITSPRTVVPQHRPTRPHQISSSLEDWL